jgi:hypothetical protein
MPRKIIAIQVNTSPARYVTAEHKRFDGSVAVELTENENLAIDYGTSENAAAVITRIFNPFERTFKPVAKSVIQPVQIGEYFNEQKKIS